MKKTFWILTFIFGFSLNINAKEMRIITTNFAQSEIVKELGFEQNIVATDITSFGILDKEKVQNIGYHRNLNTEALLALKPSHIILSSSSGPKNTIDILKKSKIEIVILEDAKTIFELQKNITKISTALEQEKKAKKLNSKLASYKKTIENSKFKNQDSLFFFSMRGKNQLGGKNTSLDYFLNLFKMNNLAKFNNLKEVNKEEALLLKPDVIFVSQTQNFKKQEFIKQNNMQKTNAVKNKQIYHIDPSFLVAGLSISSVLEAQKIAK